MPEIISFDGFKLKPSQFKFKNKKEKYKFFDEALIESSQNFIRLSDEMLLEKMHISFSWYMLTRILSYSIIALNFILIFFLPTIITSGIAGLSILLFIISIIFSKKLDNFAFGRNFNKAFNEDDTVIETIRQNLINKRNSK